MSNPKNDKLDKDTTPATEKIRISFPGAEEILVDPTDKDTVASVLKRAEVVVPDGYKITMGKQEVANPEEAAVSPGDIIMIAGRPRNGN